MSAERKALGQVCGSPDCDWKRAYYDLSEMMQDDLRPLLQALGLFDGARAQSPRDVLHECVRRAQDIRSHLDSIWFGMWKP